MPFLSEPAAHTPLRPSACPGLLRVVQALDGGLCRVKLPGGVLGAEQAEQLAAAAARYASGVLEATNRSNLQIRGIGSQATELAEALLAAGLGPREAAADDVRNLMLSPAAGIDPDRLIDVGPLAAQILASLERQTSLHQLSAKFAVQLDGAEGLAMVEHHHDLWLSAMHHQGQTLFAVGLAGSPVDGSQVAVAAQDAHALVLAVLERFVQVATPAQTRMRDLGASLQDLLQGSGLKLHAVAFRRARVLAEPLGIHAQSQPGRVSICAGAPLGRLDARVLHEVAQLARRYGDGTLRMTPWQGLLLPHIAAGEAREVASRLDALGLLTDAAAPLAQLLACTGAAGCAKGHSDTKADALRLAQLLPRAQAVHLSGCPRSCACAHGAPVTLLATGPGHYDLYVRDAQGEGFGALQARNLSLQAAAAWLGRSCSDSSTDKGTP